MDKSEYDIAIIGSGPGGYVAATRAAQLGFKTICIEKHKTLGGTCLNVGCIPSKTLLQTTEIYSQLRNHGKEQGIEFNQTSIDFDQMMSRKEAVVKSLTDGVAGIFKRNKVDRLHGTARFLTPYSIEVTHDGSPIEVKAKYFILATGSEPTSLPFLPFDEKTVLSSTGALSLKNIPKKMIVIGGGVIGVELASVYQRLGTEVVIVEMLDKICIAMDEAISKALLQTLKKQGIQFYLGAKVTQANVKEGSITLQIEDQGKPVFLEGNVALVAVGRRPYSEGLDLKKIGIELDARKCVPVDGFFRTSQPHIYAIGDLIEGVMLAHKASDEGVAAVEIIAGLKPQINYLAIPNVIYTYPEAAAVGMTENEVKASGLEYLVGTAFFKGNARARCIDETDGFVKVIGEKKTHRLLGMHILGPHASEMMAEGVVAMEKALTLDELGKYSYAHPTLTESIKEAALASLGIALI
jgi:dihydrolipoamide dehydrogenase